MKFHKFWTDARSETPRVIFITEYMTSGSLKQFLKKTRKSNYKTLNEKVYNDILLFDSLIYLVNHIVLYIFCVIVLSLVSFVKFCLRSPGLEKMVTADFVSFKVIWT